MRRLFVLLALCYSALADAFILDDGYLINGDEINASAIINLSPKADFIIDRFGSKSAVQFPFNRLKRMFAEHNIAIDSPHPIITFYYSRDIDMELIKEALIDRFTEAYPSININDIKIKPLSFSDIDNLTIAQVDISQNALRRSKGSFAVWFGANDAKVRRLFFSFEIEANLRLLQAAKQIERGTILSGENLIEVFADFDRMSSKPIDRSAFGKIAAKSRLNKGDIITDRSVVPLPDIRKNAQIMTELISNGVKISFIGVAQNDADIGELVRIKDQNKRVFTARVISKELARVE
ncbi:MAG: flagellar basal body P-ring formation chaperone FlgA [Helicobacteraceae bacterium]|jgi:flagella basal body P-ring formation protein FlgA|nr:flagellar basal body P-ring formation chaperone FlgA [Helicobacteraceae bacterium]